MTHPEQPTSSIHLPLGKSVLAVELYDIVSGKQIFTFHRDGKYCTFAEEIPHKDFILTLRLDWGALNEGDPTLDLDVTRLLPDGTRKRIKPKRNPQHHTTLSPLRPDSKEPRTYDLEYEGLTMRLFSKKSFAVRAEMSAYIVDSESKPAAAPDEA